MNLFDHCVDNTLGSELKWLNEPATWSFKQDGSLEVIAPPKSDFFIDPSGKSTRSSAPFLYKQVKGDFQVETRLSVEMKDPYDSGCLMIMSDESHWAKLCFEFFENTPTIISVVTNPTSDDCISCKVEVRDPFLKIVRTGNCFSFYYSEDGEKWETIRYFGLDCSMDIKVGVVAQSPTSDEGCRITYSHLVMNQPNKVNEPV
ncbi:DUF1349 domain-containing protein [Paenibacillus sp. sptzw28]|uniref:DUF1349 domain-containing protein n=1 Tax=Paenibacillus sp. sptzw28 TaxID=715179 RepID=UPI001C6E4B21|nr:DUF1349 domain-containing protein [Paenibacillus sp. sptzw28]QYR21159.1 DUF1349 domain-containing protein [Paenibacillus sp. sptzw28]